MSDFNLKVGTKVDTSTIQKELNAKEYKVTATIVIKGGDAYEKTVRKLKDESGKLYETTELVNKSTGKTTAQLTKVSETAKKASAEIQTASKHTKTLGQDFLSTAGKVAKFGAITAVIGLFTKTLYEAVEVVKETDKAMTEFNKVSDYGGAQLDSYTKKLGELGTEVARTKSEMISASTEFVKGGYTEEQSAQLAKTASLYQNVADSEISAGESSAYLISQMKAFNITANDAITIIDKTNEVNKTAFLFGNI